MSRRPSLDIADAVMLGVVVIWGANTVFVKAILGELSPFAFVFAIGFGRFLIVVLLLFLWLGFRRRPRAPARGGVGRTVPYLFLAPVVSGSLAALWLDEQFGLVKIAGAGLVLAGMAVVRFASAPGPGSVSSARQTSYSGVNRAATISAGSEHGGGNPANRNTADQPR